MEYSYDGMERLDAIEDDLGIFDYQYASGDYSQRIDKIVYPTSLGNVVADFDYYGNTGTKDDGRLEKIKYTSSSTTISEFGYEYEADGNITDWSRQLGASPSTDYTEWTFS